MSHPTRQVECTIPILPVRDLRRSLAFYTQKLGFKLDWGGESGATIASVSRDTCAIMLSETVAVNGEHWVWIGLEDDNLFRTFRDLGVKVRQEPKNFAWAYEMKFEDPDGNILWLGTESRKDLPLNS